MKTYQIKTSSTFQVLICALTGAFLGGMAAGLIPVEPSKIHAPLWLIGCIGGMFWLAAAMMLLKNQPRANDFLASVLLTLFGTVGGWVALHGEADQFGGGIPFISQAANNSLARGLFGFGALICLGLARYALKRALRRDV